VKNTDFRKSITVEFIELSIQIFATETCSKITRNHAVWIYHWNDIEIAYFEHFDGLGRPTNQTSDKPFHHVGRV
jgi:hypothetical protein